MPKYNIGDLVVTTTRFPLKGLQGIRARVVGSDKHGYIIDFGELYENYEEGNDVGLHQATSTNNPPSPRRNTYYFVLGHEIEYVNPPKFMTNGIYHYIGDDMDYHGLPCLITDYVDGGYRIEFGANHDDAVIFVTEQELE